MGTFTFGLEISSWTSTVSTSRMRLLMRLRLCVKTPALCINVPSLATVLLRKDTRHTSAIASRDILEMSVSMDLTVTQIMESTCVKMEENAG